MGKVLSIMRVQPWLNMSFASLRLMTPPGGMASHIDRCAKAAHNVHWELVSQVTYPYLFKLVGWVTDSPLTTQTTMLAAQVLDSVRAVA